MYFNRTIAGIGATALAFIALSWVNRRFRHPIGESSGKFVSKTAKRMEGIIRRHTADISITDDDVI